MSKISIAGLQLVALSKADLLKNIGERLRRGQKTVIATIYSEFLYAALMRPEIKTMLNTADLSVADGIGILWADAFLKKPFYAKTYHGKVCEGFLQILHTGLSILVNPKSVRKTFPETIVGALLFWDLANLAETENYSVYLLGGFDDTPEIVRQKLKERFPNLKVIGTSNKQVSDTSIVGDIQSAKPDLLFAALGPLQQEQWIADNIEKLPIKLAIGLGGTFDYVAGKVAHPPLWMRSIGLEWLYRLITQPKRYKRIWNATFGLCQALLRYKVFTSQPYRQNVIPILINTDGKILVCMRNPNQPTIRWFGRDHNEAGFENYWQLPQGGIDEGESPEQAAARELFEETGVTSAKLIKFSESKNTYDWQSARRPLWGNPSHFRGQEQHLAYFTFTGTDEEIKVDNHEFVNYKWVSIEQLSTTLHPERTAVAEIIKKDFPLLELQRK